MIVPRLTQPPFVSLQQLLVWGSSSGEASTEKPQGRSLQRALSGLGEVVRLVEV